MNCYNAWIDGYKVEISDWYDGVHDHLNIAYYKPGSPLSKPPAMEHGYLFPKKERPTIMRFMNSVVHALTNKDEFWKQGASETVIVISVAPPALASN